METGVSGLEAGVSLSTTVSSARKTWGIGAGMSVFLFDFAACQLWGFASVGLLQASPITSVMEHLDFRQCGRSSTRALSEEEPLCS